MSFLGKRFIELLLVQSIGFKRFIKKILCVTTLHDIRQKKLRRFQQTIVVIIVCKYDIFMLIAKVRISNYTCTCIHSFKIVF